MKKRLFAAAALTLAFSAVFTACGDGKDIGQAAAKEAAFSDAGVQESDVTRLKVTKDRDDGKTVYEIEFDVQEKEYSYDIDASNGDILSYDQEINSNYQGQQSSDSASQTDASAASASETTPTPESQPADDSTAAPAGETTALPSGASISIDDAKSTALAKVPGATDQDIRIELDYDDGKACYEGDIIYNHMEYEFKIDASNGNIIEWSEEKW